MWRMQIAVLFGVTTDVPLTLQPPVTLQVVLGPLSGVINEFNGSFWPRLAEVTPAVQSGA